MFKMEVVVSTVYRGRAVLSGSFGMLVLCWLVEMLCAETVGVTITMHRFFADTVRGKVVWHRHSTWTWLYRVPPSKEQNRLFSESTE